MLHRDRTSVRRSGGRGRGRRPFLWALVGVVLLSSCRTAPEIAPAPENLPLPSDSALYLLVSPRERGDLGYLLLESLDIGPGIANRIDLAGISVAREPESPEAMGDRGVVVAVRGDLPTRRLARALRRSDEWHQETDIVGRKYFRQEEGPWLLILPGDGLLILGNGAPEGLPREPPIVSPWPPDFLERFATVPVAAFVPSPGGGAVSTPFGGVLPLQELRFYAQNSEEETTQAILSGEAVLDNERSARAFEAIVRLLALGIAAEMGMEPGQVRQLLEVAQRENLVTFTVGPLDTAELFDLSSELLEGYGGADGLPGGAR